MEGHPGLDRHLATGPDTEHLTAADPAWRKPDADEVPAMMAPRPDAGRAAGDRVLPGRVDLAGAGTGAQHPPGRVQPGQRRLMRLLGTVGQVSYVDGSAERGVVAPDASGPLDEQPG